MALWSAINIQKTLFSKKGELFPNTVIAVLELQINSAHLSGFLFVLAQKICFTQFPAISCDVWMVLMPHANVHIFRSSAQFMWNILETLPGSRN